MKDVVETNFAIGQVVRHKHLDFRGVIFDVDPEFNNTEEWYQSIPAQIRPKKDQPFYHVYAERQDCERNIAEYEGKSPQDYPGDNTQYLQSGKV